MGHLCIVNNETIENVIKTGYISTKGDLGKLPIKTISDLFADVLAMRKDDLVFPWVIKGDDNSNIGFRYMMRVSGQPIYVKGEEYPIKVPIKDIYEFQNALPETMALNLFGSKLLWNAIGKKSLGRGRSITHQTLFEDKLLLYLMKKFNSGNQPSSIPISQNKITASIPITINLTRSDRRAS